jgi:hypothetical protein
LSNAGKLSTTLATLTEKWNLRMNAAEIYPKYDDSKKGVAFFLFLFYAVRTHLLLSSAAVSIPTN